MVSTNMLSERPQTKKVRSPEPQHPGFDIIPCPDSGADVVLWRNNSLSPARRTLQDVLSVWPRESRLQGKCHKQIAQSCRLFPPSALLLSPVNGKPWRVTSVLFVPLASWLLHLGPLSPQRPARPGHVHFALSQIFLPLAMPSYISIINFLFDHKNK